MKKLLAALAVLALLAVPASAENWTEVDISAFARVDGGFRPYATVSVVNYINDRGIGLYVTEDRSAGPWASWRLWKHLWSIQMENAIHIVGGTDLVQEDNVALNNATYGVDIRWGWTGATDISVTTKLLWESQEGGPTIWTPAIGLVIAPSGL